MRSIDMRVAHARCMKAAKQMPIRKAAPFVLCLFDKLQQRVDQKCGGQVGRANCTQAFLSASESGGSSSSHKMTVCAHHTHTRAHTHTHSTHVLLQGVQGVLRCGSHVQNALCHTVGAVCAMLQSCRHKRTHACTWVIATRNAQTRWPCAVCALLHSWL
eukprot:1161296-Pelagomonas_calceolata.AAC.16